MTSDHFTVGVNPFNLLQGGDVTLMWSRQMWQALNQRLLAINCWKCGRGG